MYVLHLTGVFNDWIRPVIGATVGNVGVTVVVLCVVAVIYYLKRKRKTTYVSKTSSQDAGIESNSLTNLPATGESMEMARNNQGADTEWERLLAVP